MNYKNDLNFGKSNFSLETCETYSFELFKRKLTGYFNTVITPHGKKHAIL